MKDAQGTPFYVRAPRTKTLRYHLIKIHGVDRDLIKNAYPPELISYHLEIHEAEEGNGAGTLRRLPTAKSAPLHSQRSSGSDRGGTEPSETIADSDADVKQEFK